MTYFFNPSYSSNFLQDNFQKIHCKLRDNDTNNQIAYVNSLPKYVKEDKDESASESALKAETVEENAGEILINLKASSGVVFSA